MARSVEALVEPAHPPRGVVVNPPNPSLPTAYLSGRTIPRTDPLAHIPLP